ncbi:MAG: coat protein [Koper totivirus 2]|nr:MAG: coat protein [Koper totivirus 2]
MDAFVQRFFAGSKRPTVPVTVSKNWTTLAWLKAGLSVSNGEMSKSRVFQVDQPMTMLGRMEATMASGASSLDGLNREFLTPEGTVNMKMLSDHLKATSGLQTHVLSAHMDLALNWDWSDNHVTLLLNMMRYAIMRHVHETHKDVEYKFEAYDDGHVQIDPNALLPAEWARLGGKWADQWPCGAVSENLPSYVHLTESTPNDHHSAIDLRACTTEEARFVLLMLGKWVRRTPVRLDFSTPLLADTIYYRARTPVSNLDDWIEPAEDGSPPVEKPTLPSAKVAWNALKSYVTSNNVFDSFSTALYILSATWYQFMPVTAEGMAWLGVDWTIHLPRFHSIRGRYKSFNDGTRALINTRALNEWAYVANDMKYANMIALTFVQAYQTGMGVRAYRLHSEEVCADLYSTQATFYHNETMISAAAAEAVRCDVPLSGMSGVYITTTEDFDTTVRGRVVPIKNTTDDGLDGYDVITRTTRGAAAGYDLNVPAMPFAGFPTMLVPLNCFPYDSPFSLKGVIRNEDMTLKRAGWSVKPREAWHAINVARLCGYDVETQVRTAIGSSQFFAPNDVHFVWPVMTKTDNHEVPITLKGISKRRNFFIYLPEFCSMHYKGNIEYKVVVMNRGVAMAHKRMVAEVSDFPHIPDMSQKSSVTYVVTEAMAKLRGFIRREESDFQFVFFVQGGPIPAPDEKKPEGAHHAED